jgi:hypothetical protein
MGMLQYLIIEPMQYRHPGLGWSRFWRIFDERTNGAFDEPYRRLARVWQRAVTLPQPPLMTTEEIAHVAATLRQDGFAMLPCRLSSADVSEIMRFMFATPAYGDDPHQNIQIHEDSIPAADGRYSWRTADVIALSLVQRLVLTGPYCAIAQAYLGCCPTLVTISLWLNPPFPPRAYGANNYHYDNDGPGFLKFFFLLTDMGPGTGAHYFIKGSHHPRKPPRLARSDLYKDRDIFAVYDGSDELVIGGPAGTIFAEDTRGFHRGSDLTESYRALLQLEFSIIDTPTPEDLGREYSPVAIPRLDKGIARIARKFFVPQS